MVEVGFVRNGFGAHRQRGCPCVGPPAELDRVQDVVRLEHRRDEFLRLSRRSPIPNGNDPDLVAVAHLSQDMPGSLSLGSRRVGVDGATLENLTSHVDHRQLAAMLVARVDSEDHDAAQRSL